MSSDTPGAGCDSTIGSAIAAAWHALPGAPANITIDVVARTGSTNTDLLIAARRAAPPAPVLRIALEQTAGRGRLGRSWHAPGGSAVLLSLAVPLAAPMVASATTLACGVAVVETLRREQVPAELKWPNDILLHGSKLAGLLAELAVDRDGARTLIVGLGLNLTQASGQPLDMPMRAALADAIAIDDVGAAHRVWSVRLAAAMLAAIRAVERDGFAPFAPRFDALFVWRGKPVIVIDPLRATDAEIAAGIALGVDNGGRLKLDAGGTLATVSSGEVSLRPAVRVQTD